MFRPKDDLKGRLPLFEEHTAALRAAVHRGALDGLDPHIGELMSNAVPVGLNKDNTLALPKWYEPEDGPPILMLHPGERPGVRWSNGMEKMLSKVLHTAGIELDLPDSYFDRPEPEMPLPPAFTASHIINAQYNAKPHKPVTPIFVPRFIAISTDRFRPSFTPVGLTHEIDHWDFFLNHAPKLSREDAPFYTKAELATIAEKRAYTTSYVVERNLGLHRFIPKPETLAARLEGLDPETAGAVARQQFNNAKERAHAQDKIAHSVPALALSHLFGGDELITQNEVTAYQAAGYS